MAEGGLNIALYGAMGALGEQVLLGLESEGLAANLTAVGAERSAGSDLNWRGTRTTVVPENQVAVEALDAAILALPATRASALRDELTRQGVLVIDASSDPRQHALPIVWPHINTEGLENHSGAIALPSPIMSTIAPALAPFWEGSGLNRVHVVALTGASAHGRGAEKSFAQQTLSLLNSRLPSTGDLDGILAFNVLTGRDDADALNARLRIEASRLLGPSDVELSVQRLQIPVFAGLTCAIALHFEEPVSLEALAGSFESRDDTARILPTGSGLRDALEREDVTLTGVHQPGETTLGLVAFADATHRTGMTAAKLLVQIVEEDLW